MPCPYAFALGIPGQGIHAARILGMSVNDWLATFILAIPIAFLFQIEYIYALIGFFVLGEVLHYYFGVKSAFLKMIGLEPTCDSI